MDAHTATQTTAFVPTSSADPGWIAAVLQAVEMDGLSRGEQLRVVLGTGDAADAALTGHVGDAAA